MQTWIQALYEQCELAVTPPDVDDWAVVRATAERRIEQLLGLLPSRYGTYSVTYHSPTELTLCLNHGRVDPSHTIRITSTFTGLYVDIEDSYGFDITEDYVLLNPATMLKPVWVRLPAYPGGPYTYWME